MNRIPTNKKKKEFIIVNRSTGSQIGANYGTALAAKKMAAAFEGRFHEAFDVKTVSCARSFALGR